MTEEIEQPEIKVETPEKEISEHSGLEARVKQLEMELQQERIKGKVTEIHSAWKDFKFEGNMNSDFLDGVKYAIENMKPAKEIEQHSVPVAKSAEMKTVPQEKIRTAKLVINENEKLINANTQL